VQDRDGARALVGGDDVEMAVPVQRRPASMPIAPSPAGKGPRMSGASVALPIGGPPRCRKLSVTATSSRLSPLLKSRAPRRR
jgi:hypothetical protein